MRLIHVELLSNELRFDKKQVLTLLFIIFDRDQRTWRILLIYLNSIFIVFGHHAQNHEEIVVPKVIVFNIYFCYL